MDALTRHAARARAPVLRMRSACVRQLPAQGLFCRCVCGYRCGAPAQCAGVLRSTRSGWSRRVQSQRQRWLTVCRSPAMVASARGVLPSLVRALISAERSHGSMMRVSTCGAASTCMCVMHVAATEHSAAPHRQLSMQRAWRLLVDGGGAIGTWRWGDAIGTRSVDPVCVVMHAPVCVVMHAAVHEAHHPVCVVDDGVGDAGQAELGGDVKRRVCVASCMGDRSALADGRVARQAYQHGLKVARLHSMVQRCVAVAVQRVE
jgi:hypothetical protein